MFKKNFDKIMKHYTNQGFVAAEKTFEFEDKRLIKKAHSKNVNKV